MTAEVLKNKSKEAVMDFIRERLSFEDGVLSSFRNIEPSKLEN